MRVTSDFIAAKNGGDPISLIRYFDKVGVKQNEYREIANRLEQECLKIIPLLKKYQLLLRGDTLPDIALTQTPATFQDIVEGKFNKWTPYGCIRNKTSELNNQQEQIQCLGALAISLFKVITIAQGRGNENNTPIILFGFEKFSEFDGMDDSHQDDSFFYGGTSDMGLPFLNVKALVLPKNFHDESGKIDSNRMLFPSTLTKIDDNPKYDPTEEDERRVSRFDTKRDSVLYGLGLVVPKTYFNLLAFAYKILCELQQFDNSQNRATRNKI